MEHYFQDNTDQLETDLFHSQVFYRNEKNTFNQLIAEETGPD